MKLLQINDSIWLDLNYFAAIEEFGSTHCKVYTTSGHVYICDRYSAQQLMSKICEEGYYGDDGICKKDK